MAMIIVLIVATLLCTVYLVTRKNGKTNGWQIAWLIVCAVWGIVSGATDTEKWNYTEVTHWVVQGEVTSGPTKNLIFYVIAQAAVVLILSYLAGRILNAIVRSIIARGQRTPLPNGEVRRTGGLFTPVCYYCNRPKSFWNDYPSKICGQRICRDCLKALNFDSLDTETALAAFQGDPPFETADDVIALLESRLGKDKVAERRLAVEEERAATPKPPRTGLHVLQIIGSVYCLFCAAVWLTLLALAMLDKGPIARSEVKPGRLAIFVGLLVVLLVLGILGVRGFVRWKREQAAVNRAPSLRH